MRFYERVRAIDRRIIYLCMVLAIVIPLIWRLTFPEVTTPIVQKIFDKIESLPPGSKILMAFDYDPPSAPELDPMATAIVRHACEKGHKMYFLALWPVGPEMIKNVVAEVIKKEFPDKKYGVDYVNVGFKSGGEGVITVILTDLKKLFPTDVDGRNLNDIPMTRDIKNLKNMDLIMNFSAGYAGTKEWVQYAGDPGKIPVAAGVTAVQSPLFYPYYPRQLLGMMGGIKGAAEYEAALVKGYPKYADRAVYVSRGIERMGPQAIAHLVILLFIVIGNVTFWIDRRRERAERLQRG